MDLDKNNDALDYSSSSSNFTNNLCSNSLQKKGKIKVYYYINQREIGTNTNDSTSLSVSTQTKPLIKSLNSKKNYLHSNLSSLNIKINKYIILSDKIKKDVPINKRKIPKDEFIKLFK